MSATISLMTAGEFAMLPDNGRRWELVRGLITEMNMPAPRHGEVCCQNSFLIRYFLMDRDVGRVVTNDSGVVTERDPDTVRGADVAFYSYARVPKGPLPAGYLTVSPEAVFEVRSPHDRWADTLEKVAEYLRAGVLVVCVLDPETEEAHVFYADRAGVVLAGKQELALTEIHADLRIAVARFFE